MWTSHAVGWLAGIRQASVKWRHSWPPFSTYYVVSEIRLRKSMRIYLIDNPGRIRQDLIWNDGAFFQDCRPNKNKNKKKSKMISDMRLVPDPARKLSYCKDDHTMRPICGCPENFSESLYTSMATFAEIFKGLLFRSILWMCYKIWSS